MRHQESISTLSTLPTVSASVLSTVLLLPRPSLPPGTLPSRKIVRRNRRAAANFMLAVAVASILPAAVAEAKSHLWRFNEFYSNADGTIQFIEMQECCGEDDETNTANAWIDTLGPNFNFFSLGTDLNGPTGNRQFLIATAGFAALPGAPTPDFIMPDAFFDPIAGDTVRYRSVNDQVVIPSGTMPTDGTLSIDRDLNVAVNSPTNFAGVTGSVSLPAVPSLAPTGIAALMLASLATGLAGLASFRRVCRQRSRL